MMAVMIVNNVCSAKVVMIAGRPKIQCEKLLLAFGAHLGEGVCGGLCKSASKTDDPLVCFIGVDFDLMEFTRCFIGKLYLMFGQMLLRIGKIIFHIVLQLLSSILFLLYKFYDLAAQFKGNGRESC